MKRYAISYLLLLLCGAFLASCSDEQGTEPGNDSSPVVTIYQYTASSPYNSDNDAIFRVAANSATKEAYYLAELTDDMESRLSSLGEDAYMEYVIANGTQLSNISGDSSDDFVLTDLYGTYTITVVGVGSGKNSYSTDTFTGIDWDDVVDGTYYFYYNTTYLNYFSGLTDWTPEVTLQVCTTDETLYRFKDLYGEGLSLKINTLPDYTATDSDGTYTYVRVPAQSTPYTYGSYGTISVRDVGYWQGNDAYITSHGYEGGMYEDYSCFLLVQYYVSAGSLSYGYDYFFPN